MNHGPWSIVALGELLHPVSRREALDSQKTYQLLGAHWYATGLYTKDVKTGSQIRADYLYRVEEGDFVYNRLFAWKGSFAVATAENAGCYVSNEFPCFHIELTKLNPQYLWFYFRREAAWNEALGLSHGATPTSRNRLKEANLLAMQIPLPPLTEQRRIVARIEALASKVEAARRLRQEARRDVEALSSSATENALLHGNGWKTTTIGDICEVRGGIQKTKDRVPQNNPRRYLTVAHVQRNQIDFGNPRYFEVSDEELERWRLQKGDVLVVEGNGSIDQVGRTALFEAEIEDCVHQNHLIRVRPDQDRIMPKYLNLYLNSPVGKAQMIERGRTTSGLYNLSVARIESIEVILPPLPEQHRIVAHLDSLQARLAATQAHQAATQARLEALLPSILDRAFRGEL